MQRINQRNKVSCCDSQLFNIACSAEKFAVNNTRHTNTYTQFDYEVWNLAAHSLVVEFWPQNFQVALRISPGSLAISLEQVANLLCAQANSASYTQREGKW